MRRRIGLASALVVLVGVCGLLAQPRAHVNQIQTLQEGSYGLTFQYQASPHWQHTAIIGFDRMLQGILNPRPTFHTPADSFVTIYDQEEHKLSMRY